MERGDFEELWRCSDNVVFKYGRFYLSFGGTLQTLPNGSVRMEEIETFSRGNCSIGCEHCGAFETGLVGRRGEWTPVNLIEKALTIFRKHLAEVLHTSVNIESLLSDSFVAIARIVAEVSEGASHLALITHGLEGNMRRFNPKFEKRLEEIVAAVREEIIKIIVLSVDQLRHGAKIDPELNRRLYQETIHYLRTAVNDGARVCISLQGKDMVEVRRLEVIFREICRELQIDPEVFVVDRRASYVDLGAAADNELGTEEAACDIVPDADFMKSFDRSHFLRMKVAADGTVWVQLNNPGKTYNDTLKKDSWKPVLVQ